MSENACVQNYRDFAVEFYESYVPPRCRKPRRRMVNTEIRVHFRRLRSEQAPVAIRGIDGERVIEWRWYGRKLYLPVSYGDLVCLNGQENRPATIHDLYWRQCNWSNDGAQTKAALRKSMRRYVLIDGALWAEAGEPRYVVMTFGLGHNHGGTSLSDDSHYNSNIAASRYYRIDQEEAARAAAIETAMRRGDTDDLPGLIERTSYPRYEILIPDAVRCRPAKEAGPGCPFLNQMHNLSESGLPPLAVGMIGLHMALSPDDAPSPA